MDETSCHVIDVTAPLLLAVALQANPSDVVLVGALLVRQVGELHRMHNAFDDHCAAQASSQAQKEHSAALIAAERLKGRVVDDFDGATECLRKIEANPTASQVMGFRDRSAVHDGARIAD